MGGGERRALGCLRGCQVLHKVQCNQENSRKITAICIVSCTRNKYIFDNINRFLTIMTYGKIIFIGILIYYFILKMKMALNQKTFRMSMNMTLLQYTIPMPSTLEDSWSLTFKDGITATIHITLSSSNTWILP